MMTARKMLDYLRELYVYQLQDDIYLGQRPEYKHIINKAKKISSEKRPTDTVLALLEIESNKPVLLSKTFWIANFQYYLYNITRRIITKYYIVKVQLEEKIKGSKPGH